jgi:hypothetical protein
MPRKWLRGSRSVMENSEDKLAIIDWRRVVEEAVRTMSSTYRRRYAVWSCVRRIKRDVLILRE